MEKLNQPEQQLAKEINLKELGRVLKKHLFTIIIITVIMAVAGYFYDKHALTKTHTVYRATTRVLVAADQMSTLIVMINDPSVLSEVKREMNLPLTVGQLSNEISANVVNKSQIVNITVTDPNAQRASDIAEETARVFKKRIMDMQQVLNYKTLSIQLLNEPTAPTPITITPKPMLKMAIIAGLVLGIGLAFFLESFDGSIRKNKEVELVLGIPVLGSVPRISKKNIKKKRLSQHSVTITNRGETIGFK